MSEQPPLPPAGWHPNPEDPSQLRYWDGATWTEHRAPGRTPAPRQEDWTQVDVWTAPPDQQRANAMPGWAWVLIIVAVLLVVGLIIGVIAAGTGEDGEDAPAAPAQTREPDTNEEPSGDAESAEPGAGTEGGIGPGVWLVGEDVEPGTYRTAGPVEPEGEFSYCYWSLESDASGDFEAIIANAIVDGGIPTVTLAEGNQFSSSDCGTWVPVDPASLFQNDAAGTSIDTGVWLVGEDIAPGTYRTDEAIAFEDDDVFGYCYWSRTVSLETNFTDWVGNDLVEAGRPTVTLEAGEQFETSDCGTWSLSQ